MPLEYIPVRVVRPVSTVTATFGLSAPTETDIAGSPFLACVYRVPQTTVQRDDAAPGTATLDEMQRLSVLDPACQIRVNDIAFLPQPGGTFLRAKILRVRPYSDRVQYDLETGAEGDPPPLAVRAGGDVAEQSGPEVVDVAITQDIAERASSEAVDVVSAQPAQLAAAAPIPLGQPYVNTTGRLFVLHKQMSNIAYGDDGTGAGSVPGYVTLIRQARAAGAHAFSCDAGSNSTNYTNSLKNLYTAINQENATNGWVNGQTGTVNAKGVGKFSAYITFDFSSFPENTAAILAVLQIVLKDPANLTWQGRSVWSNYVGGGGWPWAALAGVFVPVVTALRAQGINPYGIWGGEITNPDGTAAPGTVAAITAWATGCVKPFADAVWSFPSGQTPLGPSSGIPSAEMLAAGVHAAGLAYQGSLNPQYGQQLNNNVRFVEDFCGGEGLNAQYRSIFDVQKPELGVQFATVDDPDEQSELLTVANPTWPGYRAFTVAGYYKNKSGLVANNDIYLQELATGVRPSYTSDRIIAQYQTMTGAALAAPTNDPHGPIIAQDNDETVQGVVQVAATNRQVIYVTTCLAESSYIRLTQDNGYTVRRFVPAGLYWTRLPFVAGSVTIDLERSGAVVLTMTGEPILATSPVANTNNYTMWAHN